MTTVQSLQKSTDLDLHCLKRQGISGFSRTRVKLGISSYFKVTVVERIDLRGGFIVGIYFIFTLSIMAESMVRSLDVQSK